MAERFDMSFRNKEVKMWFFLMFPFIVLGAIALFTSDASTRWLPFLILLIGYAIYYPWRANYRKKQKKMGGRQ